MKTLKHFKEGAVTEANKHSVIGKIQRGHELKSKVDSSFKDIGDAQRAGDHAAGSKAFRKHERYANLERPGTWTKPVNEDEKNTHTSALGKALFRDLSKEKKVSPQQKQRNQERWAKRQQERGQGVAVNEDGMGAGAVASGPTNVTSSGAVAGMGQPPGSQSGEPGVDLRKKKRTTSDPRLFKQFRRKAPQA
jgi:hypothetical protein